MGNSELFDFRILTGFPILAIFLWLLEIMFPLRVRKQSILFRLLINISVSIAVFIIVVSVVSPVQNKAIGFTLQSGFGLMHLLQLNIVLEGVLAFLLMDLAFYYWHLLNHKVPFLWRFHNVHHLDPDLDITTAFRFHFGEILFSSVFRGIQILVIGINPPVFIIYEISFAASTLFHHSNIRMPIGLERILNRIIVTPRMHGIHHSQKKSEANSNYSTVFSFWDLLHNTIRLNVKQEKIIIGISGYCSPEDNRIGKLIAIPFRKQRDYWVMADNPASDNDSENLTLKSKLRLYE